MSRIQQILSKAEREGTLRRTHGPSAVDVPEPAFDEASLVGAGRRAARTDRLPPVEPPPIVETRAFEPQPAPHGPTVVEAGALDPILVAAMAPHAVPAEQYRSLRTRITLSENGHSRRVLLVSSPSKGDGKSVTAANLALTMAQEPGRRTVLVDADLRRPSQSALFGLPPRAGLSDVLRGTAALEDALIALPDYGLTLLPAGATPDHPAELLGSAAMRRVVDALRTRFDRVVIDSPPALPLADVGVLAPMSDGLLLVVRAGITQKPLIEEAIAVTGATRLLGLVLNDAGEGGTKYVGYQQMPAAM